MKIVRLIFVFLILFSSLFLRADFTIAQIDPSQRTDLEKQLEILEGQISDQENKVSNLQAKGKNLQSEISRLNAQTTKINLQIKAINLQLEELDSEIFKKENDIKTTQEKIDSNKDILSKGLRTVYENREKNVVSMLLTHRTFSGFFANLSSLISVEDNLTGTINVIASLQKDLQDQREVLSLKKTDASALKTFQTSQKNSIEQSKSERNNILKLTKGEESKYQEILKTSKKTAAEIRNKIFELLGGGQLTFEQAYEFAKIAEKATGVRAALILAVLDHESALGQNVGRCNYKTAMHPTRDIPIFLSLVASLDINPDSVSVSCANRDGAYGGAMGPAQFIPSTWNLYKANIALITGNNPPSPWKNADAFVGTALYLKEAGAANATITQERIAAAKYYAGGRWKTYLWSYGDLVVNKAKRFQADIDILNS